MLPSECWHCSQAWCTLSPLKMPSSTSSSPVHTFMTQLRPQVLPETPPFPSSTISAPSLDLGFSSKPSSHPERVLIITFAILCSCLLSCPPLLDRDLLGSHLIHECSCGTQQTFWRKVGTNVNWRNLKESNDEKRYKSHCVYSNVLLNSGLGLRGWFSFVRAVPVTW